MKLTPLQLEIQQQADKTESFWCIIELNSLIYRLDTRYEIYTYRETWEKYIHQEGQWMMHETRCKEYNIVWHPMNWGRLCYLAETCQNKSDVNASLQMQFVFRKQYTECMQQTVLERPVELQQLVLDFLLTLTNDN